MKRATLIFFKEDKKSILSSLQRCSEFMITNSKPVSIDDEFSSSKIEEIINFMAPYKKKKNFLESLPEVNMSKLLKHDKKTEDIAREIEKTTKELKSVQAEIKTLNSNINAIRPWLNLNILAEDIKDNEYSCVFTGRIFKEEINPAKQEILKLNADIDICGETEDSVLIVVFCLKEEKQNVLNILKSFNFTAEKPLCQKGLVRDEYDRLNKSLDNLKEKENNILNKIKDFSKNADEIEILHDRYLTEQERQIDIKTKTAQTFCIEGWVRSDKQDVVENAIKEVTVIYFLEFKDPGTDEIPPTVVKNNKFISQFETITDMFSLPSYNQIDPNFVMGIWYFIIFGFMMADAGYGFLMAVIFYLYKKIKKPKGETLKLVNVLHYSSITTMIIGVLFGSYFGETINPIIFSPLDKPVEMLVISLGIGVMHIFSGMIMKIVIQVRNKDFLSAIFDELSWMVLIVGAVLIFMPGLKNIGTVMVLVSALVILFTAGRDKDSFGGKLIGGILGLYNITSYVSDILSYSRILALGLATGVVGMVMNMLSGMVQGSFIGFILSLFIYIFGHIFNLVLGLLSAYVHDSRLQYIEFFNKFYEGGGKKFKPLSVKTKYVNLVNNKNEI